MDTFEQLNTIYRPMCEKTRKLVQEIKNSGLFSSYGFYNNHSKKIDNQWQTEYFPIPVITVKDTCDIGLDLAEGFIETKLYKEEALKFDFSKLIHKYNIEVYGIDEFLEDFYNASMDIEGIHHRIEKSSEKEIGIQFTINDTMTNEEIINIVKLCNINSFHI